MAEKIIIWSDNARIELQKILEFYTIRNNSPNYSLKLLKEIENLLITLSKNSLIGRLTSNKKTRVIPMKVYLVFYELNGNTIEIVSFWDNRQEDKNRKVK